jgi:hypothetical protein
LSKENPINLKSPNNIKPKPSEIKQSKIDENKMEISENKVEKNRSQSKEKIQISSNKLNKSGNSVNKRRGRPRLYEVNPETGKAIKGRLLNDDSLTNPKSNKVPKIIAPNQPNMIVNQTNNIPVHLTTASNGIAIFPSPSTSSSSSYSPSVSTIFIANPNINTANQRFIITDTNQTNGQKSDQKEEKNPVEDASPTEEECEDDSDEDSNENSDEDSTDEDKKSLDNTRELRSLNKTLEVSAIKPSNENEKSCENASETSKKLSNVLTHVIDGYLIKESSKPFPINSTQKTELIEENRSASSHSTPIKKQSSTHKESSLVKEIKDFKCIECGTKKPGSISKFTHKMCCSVSCFKRHSRKQQKLSKKLKSQSKENGKLLEDTTNNLDASSLSMNNSINNSKSKSHRHKHHRRHHHHGSSSSSSRDKSLSSSAKKKLKKQKTSTSEEQPMDTSSCLPPPPSLQTLTISNMNTNQSPQQHLNSSFNNPFGSNLGFNLPNNNSSPSNIQSQSSFILNSVCANNSDQNLPGGDPTEWNCDEVYQFIKCVAGIQVAQLFRSQEVDGSALSLIRDDHLVNTMQIKLGPALKIMSKFNELNSRFKQNN